jgi:hypothetical protein
MGEDMFVSCGDIYIIYEPRWNDTDRGKPNNWERYLSQCFFVHINLTYVGPVFRGERPATNPLRHGTTILGY